MNEASRENDPFYVGYLPLPPAIRRFLVPWLVGNLVLAVGMAALIATQQRDPGDGIWDTAQAKSFEGLLVLDPYPRLVVFDEAQSLATSTIIPIEQGKIGSQDRLVPHANKFVRLTGFTIQRHGNALLELLPGEEGLDVLADGMNYGVEMEPSDLGTHTLVGEIVDPKCYLGVMKPGDGKPHKVCATLCITGGIPPMFLVRDSVGNSTAYLLTDEASNPLSERYYGYIADPVKLSGRVLRQDGLLMFRADFSTLERLE